MKIQELFAYKLFTCPLDVIRYLVKSINKTGLIEKYLNLDKFMDRLGRKLRTAYDFMHRVKARYSVIFNPISNT